MYKIFLCYFNTFVKLTKLVFHSVPEKEIEMELYQLARIFLKKKTPSVIIYQNSMNIFEHFGRYIKPFVPYVPSMLQAFFVLYCIMV